MTAAPETLSDGFRVLPDDPEYQRQLQAEAEYWDRPHHVSSEMRLPVIDAYWNECFSGDAGTAWYETVHTHGRFRRGCSFGISGLTPGRRILEQNPDLHLTFYDISEESLALIRRELGGRFPGRVSTERADLNFAALPEQAYDLIVSDSCFHHLTNLECVARQVKHALTADGYFFLRDYVGEPRFQFDERKKRLFEEALAQAQAADPSLRALRVAWPDAGDWPYSPFEAVRPDETLGILRGRLSEVRVRTAGSVLLLLLFVRPSVSSAGRWRKGIEAVTRRFRSQRPAGFMDLIERLAREMIRLDREQAQAGVLLPGNAFAIYRRA